MFVYVGYKLCYFFIYKVEIFDIYWNFDIGNVVECVIEYFCGYQFECVFVFVCFFLFIDDVGFEVLFVKYFCDYSWWVLQVSVDDDDGIVFCYIQFGGDCELMFEVLR